MAMDMVNPDEYLEVLGWAVEETEQGTKKRKQSPGIELKLRRVRREGIIISQTEKSHGMSTSVAIGRLQ